MATYGIMVYDAAGRPIFTPFTNAGRIIYGNIIYSTTTITLPALDQGSLVVSWRYNRMNFPRPVSWSRSGNSITFDLPTAGLSSLQSSNGVNILILVK